MAFFTYQGKQIYFEESGSGDPLVLLHGNTASSRLFGEVVSFYEKSFRVILVDFLGHGRLERVVELATDLWHDEAIQVIELIESQGYGKVNLLGTSGGALVALNIALERPDLVNSVIADSFEGEKALDLVGQTIEEERAQSKLVPEMVAFWQSQHGDDWEQVVDEDTRAMKDHYEKIGNFFHKNLSELIVPTLLTASLKDEYAELVEFQSLYPELAGQMKQGNVYLFESGGHPAMISNGEKYYQVVKEFIEGLASL